MERRDSVWVPKEYKQKEIIIFHLPIIKRPITARQAIFFALGIPFAIAIFFLGFAIIRPIDIESKIPIVMFSIAVPIGAAILSTKKEKGKYIDEILITNIAHKKKASLVLNDKALRAYKKSKEEKLFG